MANNSLYLNAADPAAAVVRSKWVSFFVLGLLLALCGLAAIILPQVSTMATGLIIGAALGIGGLVQIAQAFRIKEWIGFVWNLLIGIIEVVGGILIYFNPFAGAIAITLLIAFVLLIQGFTQVVFALKMRPYVGWTWLLASGIVALVASAALFLHFPFSDRDAPGITVGISLLIAGCCYIAIALTARQPDLGRPARR